MYRWLCDLYPIGRSLTGPGVRETLAYLQRLVPQLTTHSVPSGTKAFDWTVPDEWSVREAYVQNEKGEKIIDFAKNNLHLVGYSMPFHGQLELPELQQYLYSLPEQPEAIPYVTSYYKRRWGFCIQQTERDKLVPGSYKVVVDTTLKPGNLNYAEALLPGREKEEIFFSTYVCHPSMANNELSGPVVATALLRWLANRKKRRYTYRFVFLPETIGSIYYLSRHHAELKKRTRAGFNLTCVGDEGNFSYLPSRLGNTLADRVALHVLGHTAAGFRRYSYLDRGSDERQYCSPGVDLPVASIMRSKYGCYPEYHTSLDDLNFVSPFGLQGSFAIYCHCIEALEANHYYRNTFLCEPQLGKRGLYPTLSRKHESVSAQTYLDIISYCDGDHDLLAIAERLGLSAAKIVGLVETLCRNKLLRRCSPQTRSARRRRGTRSQQTAD